MNDNVQVSATVDSLDLDQKHVLAADITIQVHIKSSHPNFKWVLDRIRNMDCSVEDAIAVLEQL